MGPSSKKRCYVVIMLLSKVRTLSLYACIDTMFTHNLLTYELWEDLEMPQLTTLDDIFIEPTFIGQMCIGSFIISVEILDQKRFLLFYVTKKGGSHHGHALLSIKWMSKARSLFDSDQQNQSTHKVKSLNHTGSRMAALPKETS